MIFFTVLLCLIENFLPNPVKHNKLLEIVIKGLDGCGFGQMVSSGGSRQNLFIDVIFCLQRVLQYHPALNGSLRNVGLPFPPSHKLCSLPCYTHKTASVLQRPSDSKVKLSHMSQRAGQIDAILLHGNNFPGSILAPVTSTSNMCSVRMVIFSFTHAKAIQTARD